VWVEGLFKLEVGSGPLEMPFHPWEVEKQVQVVVFSKQRGNVPNSSRTPRFSTRTISGVANERHPSRTHSNTSGRSEVLNEGRRAGAHENCSHMPGSMAQVRRGRGWHEGGDSKQN